MRLPAASRGLGSMPWVKLSCYVRPKHEEVELSLVRYLSSWKLASGDILSKSYTGLTAHFRYERSNITVCSSSIALVNDNRYLLVGSLQQH